VIKSGVAHVGFAALPIEGVEAEEVARDEWLALVSKGKFQDRTSITLKEVAKNKFLMSGGGCERHIQNIFGLTPSKYSGGQPGHVELVPARLFWKWFIFDRDHSARQEML
jgi:hypothetical protein